MDQQQNTTAQGQQKQQIQQNVNENNNGNISNLGYQEMELQNRQNEENQDNQNQQQQENVENGQEGQVEEQQQQQEQQQHVQEPINQKLVNQQPKPLIPSINKQLYINKLQNNLSKTKTELNSTIKSLQQLTQQNKKTKQQIKKLRFDYLSSRQQISKLNQQKLQLQKDKTSFQQQTKQLKALVQTYKQAGDINYYKNKINELENLIQIQKQELKMKQKMIDENQEIKEARDETGKSKINIIQLIQKYQNQNRALNKNYKDLEEVVKGLENQIKSINEQNNENKLKLAENKDQVVYFKNNFEELQQKLKMSQNESNRKVKLLEETIQQLKSQNAQNVEQSHQRSVSKNNYQYGPQKYGIKVISPSQQRDIILNSYIQLQIKYQTANSELQNLRERHYNTLKQMKKMSTTFINKKQYSQLYKKYCKLRKCLENSLINQEGLRKQLSRAKVLLSNSRQQIIEGQGSQQNIEQVYQLKQKQNIRILQQPQNQLQKVQKIVQQSSQSYKPLFTMKQQLQMKQKQIKMQKQLKQKDEKLSYYQTQVQKLNNLIKLYDKDILYKKNQIQILRKSISQYNQKIFSIQSQRITKQESQKLKSQLQQKNIIGQILEIKNLQILQENNQLRCEKNMLSELYTNLKNIYEDLLNRQPQMINEEGNEKSSQQKQVINPQMSNQACKKCQQRQEQILAKKPTSNQCQTEGLSQLYYKEIKQLLTVLKKFPKKIDILTAALQSQKSTINEVKKRYDQVNEAYGIKYRQLDQQIKSNDQWRAKQRQQIRQQFQQIRDLLLNQRLTNAIRKAKSLIQYYEQVAPEGEQNGEEGQEGEVNDKNQEGQGQEVGGQQNL